MNIEKLFCQQKNAENGVLRNIELNYISRNCRYNRQLISEFGFSDVIICHPKQILTTSFCNPPHPPPAHTQNTEHHPHPTTPTNTANTHTSHTLQPSFTVVGSYILKRIQYVNTLVVHRTSPKEYSRITERKLFSTV